MEEIFSVLHFDIWNCDCLVSVPRSAASLVQIFHDLLFGSVAEFDVFVGDTNNLVSEESGEY